MTKWNPWRVLRRREHLKLQWGYLHPSRGRIVQESNGLRTITLDRRLNQIERRCVLTHELAHDTLDALFTPQTPPALVEKMEFRVVRKSDDDLLPVTDLQEWVDQRGGVIHRWEVAEQFDVTEEVAERQMRRCSWGF